MAMAATSKQSSNLDQTYEKKKLPEKEIEARAVSGGGMGRRGRKAGPPHR
jgi:hypothetical protein